MPPAPPLYALARPRQRLDVHRREQETDFHRRHVAWISILAEQRPGDRIWRLLYRRNRVIERRHNCRAFHSDALVKYMSNIYVSRGVVAVQLSTTEEHDTSHKSTGRVPHKDQKDC